MRRHYDDDPFEAPLTRAQSLLAVAIFAAGVLVLTGLCAGAALLAEGVARVVALTGVGC